MRGSRALPGEDLTAVGLPHPLHELRDGRRERRPRLVLLDRHDGGDDLVGVHLDEVPRLWTVDPHEQVARRPDVVDVADTSRDDDRDRTERAEARDVEVAAEDRTDVAALH